MDQPRQPRISRPMAKLIDANNLERAPLAYQRNRRNRLQADIVEALQFTKCLFHQDLLFQEVCTTTEEEAILENKELDGGEDIYIVEVSWEELLIESDDIPESDTEVVY